MADRVHLPGGSGGVWYAVDPVHGPVVHRPTGPWTPAVHDLLAHLAQAGLDGVPRVFGIDAGEEIVSYVPGEALDPGIREPTDEQVADAAGWLRRYHDTVRDYDPGPRVWRQATGPLQTEQVICHNDPGTYNWVIAEGRFAGLIDWDQAGPGQPLDDLAFLCWTAAPLWHPGPTAHAGRRLRIAADAYGDVDAGELLARVAPRLLRSVERIAAGIERGDPGMLSLGAAGEPERTRARVEGLLDRAPEIRRSLG